MSEFVVSARKYRPQTFDTVVGQQSITSTLKNAIKNDHLAQAFLFCGSRGVGKTSSARILAKTINCFNRTEAIEACPAAVAAELSASNDRIDRVVTIEIRELGPVVKLLSSAALVEGSTEVVFHVGVHSPQPGAGAREFAVNWRNGGPGVVKGVESLPADLSAALRSGLQSTTVPR